MGKNLLSPDTIGKLGPLLKTFLASRVADPMGLKPVAKEHEAIPVHSDLGGCLMVDLTGQVLTYEWETEQVRVEKDGFWRDLAFQNLFEKYPELNPENILTFPTALAIPHLAAANLSPPVPEDISPVEPALQPKQMAAPAKSGSKATSRKST